MIWTVDWKKCYFNSQSTAYFNMYTQTPCSIVLVSDCCNQHNVKDVQSMLHRCTPAFKQMHVLDIHAPTCQSNLQSILRVDPTQNWVVVVNSYPDFDDFMNEEINWHTQNQKN